VLWIHPQRAAALGLKDGDPVLVRNAHGDATGPLPAKLTERMSEDAVYMVHGFGHRAPGLTRTHGRGGDDTALIRGYAVDAMSGATGMRTEFVTVERAAAGRR
jgi:thiosulfate reductase/polysulfide reductase chain A